MSCTCPECFNCPVARDKGVACKCGMPHSADFKKCQTKTDPSKEDNRSPRWQFRDGGVGQMRIRRSEWSGDSFEVVEKKDFDIFRRLMIALNFGDGENLDETDP